LPQFIILLFAAIITEGSLKMNMNYLYQVIVLKGAFEDLLIAPDRRNRLDQRVKKALHSLWVADLHTPADFKEQMRDEFSAINAVYEREVSKPNQSPIFDQTEAKIRSLKPTEKRAVLSAYFRIAVEVIKRYGVEEERRKDCSLRPPSKTRSAD
jgi:hypothetical protein